MSAGTLTLTNNSAAVSGSGTAFTTELAAGDFIVVTVGGIPYTLPVKTVNSNTSLTLVSNFTGPTQSGAAWYAVPRIAMNLVTAAVVTQAAEALRGLNYDKQNWQQVFSGTGNITVKLPDGSTWTGPAWNNVAKKGDNSDITSLSGLTTALSIEQGGTGGSTASVARVKLGLGTSATKDAQSTTVDPGVGVTLINGAWGLGTGGINSISWGDIARQGRSSFVSSQTDSPAQNTLFYGINVSHHTDQGYAAQFAARGGIGFFWRTREALSFNPWRKVYDDANTTKAADGTLKAASPIVKIFHDGQIETNDEAEGVTVSRINIGEYLIGGCTGLNSDAAWGGIDGGFDIPKDRNRQPLIWLDYQVNPDGSVLVKTFHRTYPEAPIFARNLIGMKDDAGNVIEETIKNGDPIDIPSDQYVSVRVEMPPDSLWNKRQEEAREAMEKAEREQAQLDAQS